MLVKLQNSKSILRKAKRLTHLTADLTAKVLERAIHDQTNAFLNNYQAGFRTNHSTNLCLSFLTENILKGLDEGLLTGIILIDLQKAFCTINHEILFK